MSDTEERVNNENTEQAQQVPAQRVISAYSVLLSAVEIAHSRGAFRMSEMDLITKSFNLVKAEEQQRQLLAQQAAQKASEENTEENDEEESE